MASNPVTSRKHAEELILKQATTDPSFRARLMANPREAIAQALAMQLPAHVRVTVVEETDQDIYLVLPPRTAGELTDDELMSISGGVLPASVSPTGQLNPSGEKGRGSVGMSPPPEPVLPQGGILGH